MNVLKSINKWIYKKLYSKTLNDYILKHNILWCGLSISGATYIAFNNVVSIISYCLVLILGYVIILNSINAKKQIKELKQKWVKLEEDGLMLNLNLR